ncbi:hypothetical protein PTD2_16581 [Pseudoalteromonas tunicata D2]|uniref:Uncharacterized protein n=1 Tax=Pseudoalteromonas tunicata D2 TaxID=87626 RepID=A4CEQ0_9GAMM|nr:hypothetical protein PTD2_16581 [Pseudoalteromonas tunicata D2]
MADFSSLKPNNANCLLFLSHKNGYFDFFI